MRCIFHVPNIAVPSIRTFFCHVRRLHGFFGDAGTATGCTGDADAGGRDFQSGFDRNTVKHGITA
ncbi:MAG: hypothetical protein LBF05_04925 [Tannerella sp.]|jgi:hypothetical protein|nr:hypothetical protein [Tannerella sp.]